MLGVYFSGTGNTRHCVERFVTQFDNNELASIESSDVINAIDTATDIVLGYPVYYSNIPKLMRDFILQNGNSFRGKNVFIIATMGLFSGDGAGCGARLLKKHGANIIGGLHLKMPDCIGDVKLLKKPLEQNKQLVKDAERKIEWAVDALKTGKPTKDGLSVFHHLAGLLGQRLWFYNKTASYTDKLKINSAACIGCGTCVELCPTQNLSLYGKNAVSNNRCTMCYRCISHCHQKALTLLGEEVIEQSLIENYLIK